MLPPEVESSLRRFLAEDLGRGDVTAESVVRARLRAEATLVARAEGVACGIDLVEPILRLLDPEARVQSPVGDGQRVAAGRELARLAADAHALLAAERTLLNLVQRMSGVATHTARFVAAVSGTSAAIVDTRKTAPGLRWFDKRAVRAGGGVNHRTGLWDMVLVKSNHLALAGGAAGAGARPIEAAIRAAREGAPSGTAIEIEVFDVSEALRAAEAGADLVLLDNFDAAAVADAVRQLRARFPRERVQIEASGSIHLGNVRAYAEAGVDRLSIGALTHSAPALDLALIFAPPAPGGR